MVFEAKRFLGCSIVRCKRAIADAKPIRHSKSKDSTFWSFFHGEQVDPVPFRGSFRRCREVTAVVSKTCQMSFGCYRCTIMAKARRFRMPTETFNWTKVAHGRFRTAAPVQKREHRMQPEFVSPDGFVRSPARRKSPPDWRSKRDLELQTIWLSRSPGWWRRNIMPRRSADCPDSQPGSSCAETCLGPKGQRGERMKIRIRKVAIPSIVKRAAASDGSKR